MRFIKESGGIELGIKGGPWIDIFPYNSLDPISIEQAEKAILQDRFGWRDWKNIPIRYPETKHYSGVMGYSQQMAIRFLYKDNPLQSLHQIEAAEGGLPPALATGVYIATQQLQRQNFSSFAILMFAKSAGALIKDTRSFPLLAEAEIKDLAVNALLNVYEKPIVAPLGAGNYPRFLLKLAELCWDLKLVKNLFGKGWLRISEKNSRILLNLASAWAAHQGWKHIEIEGYRLAVKPEQYPFLWMAWMEWLESGISAQILQQQIGQRFPDLRSVLDRMDQPELINIPDDLLNGLIHSFTEDAKNHSVYIPQGTFVIILPKEYPLYHLGINALRVWVEADRLYATALGSDNQPLVSVFWKPEQTAGIWACPPELQPLMTLTLSALWRDLRVAGEEALPKQLSLHAEQNQTQNQQKPAISEQRGIKKSQPRPTSPSIRLLPGRKLILQGIRTWGTQAERELIQRRAHGVRGHLRRLPSGWKPSQEAIQLAENFGVLTPAGYTFVRPHVRGKGETPVNAPAEAVIKARGLASVITLLKG